MAAETPTAGRRFWLDFQGRSYELGASEVSIGRSSSCHLVLDDGLVSRRHARIVVAGTGVLVEDLGSANGVFVNGRRVAGSQSMAVGDELQIGTQQFALRADAPLPTTTTSDRFSADTLQGVRVAADVAAAHGAPSSSPNESTAEPRSASEVELTRRESALELLGGVADKVLAMGRGDEAERILSTALNNVLAESRLGHHPSPPVLSRAASYAAKLAEATGRGKWLDYAIELYTVLRQPLPIDLVDRMYALLRRVDAVNVLTLRAYLSVLHAQAPTHGPNERFAILRLEGLERLAALKSK